MAEGNSQPVVVEMKQIERRFGSVVALRGVDFTVRKGEVRALMGDNGAGKSTLLKLIDGEVRGLMNFEGGVMGKCTHRELVLNIGISQLVFQK